MNTDSSYTPTISPEQTISEWKAVAITSVSVVIARNGKGYQKFRLRMPRKLKDVWYEDLRYKTHDFREKLERLFSDTLLRLFEVVAGLKPEPQVKMLFIDKIWRESIIGALLP